MVVSLDTPPKERGPLAEAPAGGLTLAGSPLEPDDDDPIGSTFIARHFGGDVVSHRHVREGGGRGFRARPSVETAEQVATLGEVEVDQRGGIARGERDGAGDGEDRDESIHCVDE